MKREYRTPQAMGRSILSPHYLLLIPVVSLHREPPVVWLVEKVSGS